MKSMLDGTRNQPGAGPCGFVIRTKLGGGVGCYARLCVYGYPHRSRGRTGPKDPRPSTGSGSALLTRPGAAD